MSLDEKWEAVREFHRAFGHPNPEAPVMLDAERAGKRAAWMLEEIGEFLTSRDVTEQSDAMIDLIYFALGTMVEMGVRPDRLFEIVQHANMSKLGPDGKPLYHPDGKTRKPDNWEDPEPKLRAEIERQSQDS